MTFSQCWNGSRFGWEKFGNYTGSKPKIKLEQDAWDSARLATNIFYRLAHEIMGFDIRYTEYTGGYDNVDGPRLQAGISDVVMELWTTGVPVTWFDHGSIGYSGRSGMYIPTWLADENPTLAFDWWRFFQNPIAVDLMAKQTWKPHYYVNPDGTPICNNIVKGCMNGTYHPSWWTPASESKFLPMWHIDPTWSQYHYERMIDGLQINAELIWLGPNYTPLVEQALANRTAFIFYNWKPSSFVATHNVTRLMFPDSDNGQYQKWLVNNVDTPIESDEPTTIITKATGFDFGTSFPDVVNLLSMITIGDNEINQMLVNMLNNNWTYDVAVCDWMHKNEKEWSSWIPEPPKIITTCPIVGQCPAILVLNVQVMQYVQEVTKNPAVLLSTAVRQDSAEIFVPRALRQDTTSGKASMDCSNYGVMIFFLVLGSFVATFLLLFVPAHETPTIDLLLFYFQVVNLIFKINISHFKGMESLENFLALASLDLDGMATSCPAPLSGVSKQLFRFVLPCLFFIHTAILYFTAQAMKQYYPALMDKLLQYLPGHAKHVSIKVIFLRIFQIVVTFVLMPLVEACLAILDCRNLMGVSVDFQAPDAVCFHKVHLPAAIFAILVLVLLLGVYPSLLIWKLYRINKAGQLKYNEENLTVLDELNMTLYADYRKSYYFMGPLLIWERGFLVLIFQMLIGKIDGIGFAYVCILAVVCFIRIYVQPYLFGIEAYMNREIVLCWLILMALNLSTLESNHTSIEGMVTFLLILPAVLHVLRWGFSAWQAKYLEKNGGGSSSRASHSGFGASGTGGVTSGRGSSRHGKKGSEKGNSIENLNRQGSKKRNSVMDTSCSGPASGVASSQQTDPSTKTLQRSSSLMGVGVVRASTLPNTPTASKKRFSAGSGQPGMVQPPVPICSTRNMDSVDEH
ncbi:hypothetical protein HDU98_001493 [Podochytrium sp. JEL0797]|nr:hypothetical protein HDU98_001493 [Podochytrium sp. JEL0797]